jgi:hypothetical protein
LNLNTNLSLNFNLNFNLSSNSSNIWNKINRTKLRALPRFKFGLNSEKIEFKLELEFKFGQNLE